MAIYEFGTDGVRGKANVSLPAWIGWRLGSFLAAYYKNLGQTKVLIGKDTRISSSMYESAVAAGLSSHGMDAYLLGYGPTPAVAHLVVDEGFACGIMISASHNPYYDNGLKVISPKGCKLERELEEKIENYLNSDEELPLAQDKQIGHIYDYREGLNRYKEWLKKMHPLDLKGMKIALDTANGAATYTAESVLRDLGADVTTFNNQPDGYNINTECGSTHPEAIARIVKENDYAIGFAFDGDADRLITIAGDGTIVDGDKMIYALGKYLKQKGKLPHDTVVGTVMANLGFFRGCRKAGMECKVTPVGDKYVYEEMGKGGYELGGEQSGHIIFRSQETTGDGLMSALNILEMILDTGKNINQLTDDLFIYPQLLVNVPVKDKKAIQQVPQVKAVCDEVTQELGEDGRLLVRPSGTEPLLRIMVEAKTDELCARYCEQVASVVRKIDETQF